ncbi:MAG TPA: glycosyltransferase family 39 protein [Chitinophagaceae bacterium]|nr:glycosyltransferase family 39 protein [Chitinophagaceae bacterium]
MQTPASSRLYQLLLTLAIAVNFSGLFMTIIGPDGTLYASVAKTMVLKNNYLELFGNGTDWLDKPHFPFWITALFFKVFGINDWSYKLPAILFLLLGAWYTWLFAKKFYNDTIASWSVLILLTAQHIILSNTDVRAEPYLTTLIIGSVYHYHRAWSEKNFLQLLLGSLLAACAVMTKGIFAVIPIMAGLGIHLMATRQWKEILNIRWLIAAVLVLIFITPELYALYYQFDLHPEKIVFGRTHVSGLKFFFWDSQFGRFFNTGPIKGKGDPSFFLHTTLWAFLPWSILLYIAIVKRIRDRKNASIVEWYCIGSGLVTFLMFSLSKFQLPHYLNIVFPFFAILTASYIYDAARLKHIQIIQYSLVVLLILAAAGLHLFFKPGITNYALMAVMGIVFILILTLPKFFEVPGKEIIIGRTVLAAVLINLYLNGFFYPRLLTYQGGTAVARYANEKFKNTPVIQLKSRYSYPLEFYLDAPLITIDNLNDTMGIPKPSLLLLYQEDDSLGMVPMQSFYNFPISKINKKFIDPATRGSQLKQLNLYVVR